METITVCEGMICYMSTLIRKRRKRISRGSRLKFSQKLKSFSHQINNVPLQEQKVGAREHIKMQKSKKQRVTRVSREECDLK
jgi:phosphorylcholine metabolism protein LicD